MAESVTRNTTYLTLAYIGQKILSFFYFVAVARALAVEDLGKYTFAISFTTLFAVFVDLGLNSTLVREVAKFKERAQQLLSTALAMRLVLSLLIYGVVVLVINLLGYPLLTKQLVYLSGVTMILDQATAIFWAVFRGYRTLKMESISVVVNQLIILISGLLILYLRLPLVYLIIPFILASSFSFLFAAGCVWQILNVRFSFCFDRVTAKYLLSVSVFFALIAIFSRVYGNIDLVLLSKLVGDKAVGWYSVALKIPFAFQFIPAALAASIFPAFSHHYLFDREQLRLTFERVMKFLLIAVVPVSLGLIVLSQPIILFFYGAPYLPAVRPLQILMSGLLFVFLNFPLGSLMNGCNRQKTNTLLVGVTMIINVVLNILLIPRFSFVGASVAFLISHGFLFVAGSVVARQIVQYDGRGLLAIAGKTMASGGLMLLILLALINSVHFLVLIPLAAVVYFLLIFSLKTITWSEVKMWRSRLRPLKGGTLAR